MHARLIAITIAIATAIVATAFFLVGRPAAVDPIRPISVIDVPTSGIRLQMPRELPRPGAFAAARPCLIATISCLELSPEPFAPCLLAVERCAGEWQMHLLRGGRGPTR